MPVCRRFDGIRQSVLMTMTPQDQSNLGWAAIDTMGVLVGTTSIVLLNSLGFAGSIAVMPLVSRIVSAFEPTQSQFSNWLSLIVIGLTCIVILISTTVGAIVTAKVSKANRHVFSAVLASIISCSVFAITVFLGIGRSLFNLDNALGLSLVVVSYGIGSALGLWIFVRLRK